MSPSCFHSLMPFSSLPAKTSCLQWALVIQCYIQQWATMSITDDLFPQETIQWTNTQSVTATLYCVWTLAKSMFLYYMHIAKAQLVPVMWRSVERTLTIYKSLWKYQHLQPESWLNLIKCQFLLVVMSVNCQRHNVSYRFAVVFVRIMYFNKTKCL